MIINLKMVVVLMGVDPQVWWSRAPLEGLRHLDEGGEGGEGGGGEGEGWWWGERMMCSL